MLPGRGELTSAGRDVEDASNRKAMAANTGARRRADRERAQSIIARRRRRPSPHWSLERRRGVPLFALLRAHANPTAPISCRSSVKWWVSMAASDPDKRFFAIKDQRIVSYFGSPWPDRICADPPAALRKASSKVTPRMCQWCRPPDAASDHEPAQPSSCSTQIS